MKEPKGLLPKLQTEASPRGDVISVGGIAEGAKGNSIESRVSPVPLKLMNGIVLAAAHCARVLIITAGVRVA